MAVHIDDDARVFIWWDAVTDFDPTGSSVTLEIADVTYPMSWQAAPVAGVGSWTRTAHTVAMFVGSALTPTGSDVQLPPAVYVAKSIVTGSDGQDIVGKQSRVIVG